MRLEACSHNRPAFRKIIYETHNDWDAAIFQYRLVGEPVVGRGPFTEFASYPDDGQGSTGKGTLRELCEESGRPRSHPLAALRAWKLWLLLPRMLLAGSPSRSGERDLRPSRTGAGPNCSLTCAAPCRRRPAPTSGETDWASFLLLVRP